MRPGLRFLGISFLLLLLGFKDAFWGAMAVIFEYHNHPRIWWFGEAIPQLRYTLIFTGGTLLLVLFQLRKLDIGAVLKSRQFWLVTGILLVAFLRFGPVESPRMHSRLLDKDFKSILMMVALAATVRTPGRLRMFMWVFMIGCAGLGMEAFRNPRRSSGRLYGIGTADSYADNYFGAHLALAVPMLINMMVRGKKWEKIAAILIGPFVLEGIILTSSRGAFLATAVSAGTYLILTLPDRRVRGICTAILIAGCTVFAMQVDQVFIDRISTLFGGTGANTGEEEEKFTGAGRTEIWAAGVEIVSDHPMGLGGGGFAVVAPEYLNEEVSGAAFGLGVRRNKAAHNTPIRIAADYGILALILYVWLIWTMGIRYWRQWRQYKSDPELPGYAGDTLALVAAFAGFGVTLLVGNRYHYEAFFWLVAISISLGIISRWIEKQRESEDFQKTLDEDYTAVAGVNMRMMVILMAGSLILLF